MSRLICRRQFLGDCAIAGGLLFVGGMAVRRLEAAEAAGWPTLPPVKIYVVYVGLAGAWPKPDFDAPAEVAKFQKYLDELKQRMGDVEFLGGIPLDVTVRQGGDAGIPAVAQREQGPAAQALTALARTVAARMSVRAARQMPVLTIS